jgi:hypothetical protein
MRFMAIYRTTEKTDPHGPEHFAEMGQFIEEMTKSGALLATGGLAPSAKGARVRLSKGKITVTDGPFPETKELIAGFAILQAKSKEEAVELCKRFLHIAGDGESEVREMADGPDPGPAKR